MVQPHWLATRAASKVAVLDDHSTVEQVDAAVVGLPQVMMATLDKHARKKRW